MNILQRRKYAHPSRVDGVSRRDGGGPTASFRISADKSCARRVRNSYAYVLFSRKRWTRRGNLPIVRRMSKAAKTAGPGSPASPLAFEEALQKLETIVEAMESDELPLETLLARYEEGTRLAEICQAKLADAEIKIKQLEKTSDGDFLLKPLDGADAEH